MQSSDSYNADELGGYQAISSAAVLALFLGILSLLAFAFPIFLIIPLAAIVVAYVALAKIRLPESGLSGTRIALAGLALAIILGVGAGTRIVVINMLVSRDAVEEHQHSAEEHAHSHEQVGPHQE